MAKPAQCRLVGGVSLLLGIAVLVASSLFLHDSSYEKCSHGDGGSYGHGGFQYPSANGGVHGGQVYGSGPTYGHHRTVRDVDTGTRSGSYAHANAHGGNNYQGYGPPSYQDNIGFQQGSYGSDFLNGPYCKSVIRKYKTCAIIGIVASIAQILVSAIFCFANKTTVKTLSVGWAGIHLLILIAYIAIAAVVLAEKRFEEQKAYNRSNYGDYDDYPGRRLAFAIVSLITAFFLILMILFACLTLKNSDYDDYSVDPKEPVVTRKKMLES